MESVIGAYFDKIEQALGSDELDLAENLAIELDREVRSAVEAGAIDASHMEGVLERFGCVIKQLQVAKKVKLAEISKLSKGSVGIKAYKGV